MSPTIQEQLLIGKGWKKSVTCEGVQFKAPISLTGKDHYFSREEAFKLETEGDIFEYSAAELMCNLRHEEDNRREEAAERAWIAAGNLPHGLPPNY